MFKNLSFFHHTFFCMDFLIYTYGRCLFRIGKVSCRNRFLVEVIFSQTLTDEMIVAWKDYFMIPTSIGLHLIEIGIYNHFSFSGWDTNLGWSLFFYQSKMQKKQEKWDLRAAIGWFPATADGGRRRVRETGGKVSTRFFGRWAVTAKNEDDKQILYLNTVKVG